MFDRGAGHWLCFRNSWQRAEAPAAPSGGTVIDVEARPAQMQMVEFLRTLDLAPYPAA